jgi:hypothetical protein
VSLEGVWVMWVGRSPKLVTAEGVCVQYDTPFLITISFCAHIV